MTNDPSSERLNPASGTGNHFSIRHLRTILISSIAWMCGLAAFIFFGSLLLGIGIFIDPKRFNPAIKAACRLILRCALIRVRVRGRGHIRSERPYLFIANHVNIFDVLVLYGYIPNYFRGIELDEHFRWFFYGPIIRRLGMIPISQTSGRSALKSLKHAQAALADGSSILILPEGGRTLDGRLQPFKRGSFVLAKNARVDIVPLAMVGAFEIYRKGGRLIRPGKMTLRFGEPIAYSAIRNLELAQLQAHVRARMLELIDQGNR
jgi:1-acyl-sn-glycerol-3-phosphate acyltransferase